MFNGALSTGAVVPLLFGLIIVTAYAFRLPISKYSALSSGIIGSAFLTLTFISLIYDIHRITSADLLELVKPIFAALLFLTFNSMFKNKQEIETFYSTPYSKIFIVVAFIGLLEAFTDTQHLTYSLYTDERDILDGKAASPFGVTYFYAAFMLIAFLFFFFKALASQQTILNSALAALSLAALVLAQSRTVIISTCVTLGIIIFIYPAYKGMPSRLLTAISGIILLFFGAVFIFLFFDLIQDKFSYIFDGLNQLLIKEIRPAIGEGSLNMRIFQIYWVIQNSELFIFGSGIGKGYAPQLESFYALYAYRYGLIGIFFYAIIYFTYVIATFTASKKALKEGHINSFSFFLAIHFFLLSLPVTSFSSVISDQYSFMLIYYGGLGVALNYIYNRSTRKNLRISQGPVSR